MQEKNKLETERELTREVRRLREREAEFKRMFEEHGHAESMLRERAVMFRAITRMSRGAIIMVDGEEKILFWNWGACKIFGYTAREVMGKEFHRVTVLQSCRAGYLKEFTAFRGVRDECDRVLTVERDGITKDGRAFPMEVSLSPVKISGRWSAVVIARDISTKKILEGELREKSEGLERMSRIMIDRELKMAGLRKKLYVVETSGSKQ